jgi:hypothetical protein
VKVAGDGLLQIMWPIFWIPYFILSHEEWKWNVFPNAVAGETGAKDNVQIDRRYEYKHLQPHAAYCQKR